MSKSFLSPQYIILFFIIAFCIYLIYPILILVFFAFIFATALRPTVDLLAQDKIPRWLVILAIYIIGCLLLIGLFLLLIPPLGVQADRITTDLPNFISDVINWINTRVLQQDRLPDTNPLSVLNSSDIIDRFADQFITATTEAIGFLFSLFSFIIISFYFLLQPDLPRQFISSFLPKEKRKNFHQFWQKGEAKLGAWVRGELTLMTIIGIYVYIVLLAFGLSEYAIIIAVIAGTLDVIPLVGSTTSVILGIIVGFERSPLIALLIGITLILGQQLQGNLILPAVMKKSLGIHPLIILISLSIGGHLLGAVGALLAVPLAAVCSLIFEEWRQNMV